MNLISAVGCSCSSRAEPWANLSVEAIPSCVSVQGLQEGNCYTLLEQNRYFHAGVWFFSWWDRKIHKVKARLVWVFLSLWSFAEFFTRADVRSKNEKSSNHHHVLLFPRLRHLSSYMFKKIMTMLSVLLCEEYPRPWTYPEIDFLFLFF